jgi:hypothetical protein
LTYKRFSIIAGAVVGAGSCALGVAADAHHRDHPPTTAEVELARGTSDLMTNTVVAALVQEINETTPANVAQGNLSISLIFNDHNRDMRLVGTRGPLSQNDLPADDFERAALAAALKGTPHTAVEKIGGQWYYRRSNPLSNFKPQCAMCHANFNGVPSTENVGALMLRVPITTR